MFQRLSVRLSDFQKFQFISRISEYFSASDDETSSSYKPVDESSESTLVHPQNEDKVSISSASLSDDEEASSYKPIDDSTTLIPEQQQEDLSTALYFIVDTETTGLPSKKAVYWDDEYKVYGRILEIAYVICDKDGLILKSREFLVFKPLDYVIPNADFHIKNDLTTETLNEQGTDIRNVLDQVYLDIQHCSILVAYNIKYDYQILLAECFQNDFPELLNYIKSMKTEDAMQTNSRGKWRKLVDVYQECMGKPLTNAHRAMSDTLACKDVFFAYKKN